MVVVVTGGGVGREEVAMDFETRESVSVKSLFQSYMAPEDGKELLASFDLRVRNTCSMLAGEHVRAQNVLARFSVHF